MFHVDSLQQSCLVLLQHFTFIFSRFPAIVNIFEYTINPSIHIFFKKIECVFEFLYRYVETSYLVLI